MRPDAFFSSAQECFNRMPGKYRYIIGLRDGIYSIPADDVYVDDGVLYVLADLEPGVRVSNLVAPKDGWSGLYRLCQDQGK